VRPEAETRCRGAAADPARLRAHVEALGTRFVPRDFEHPENLDRAAAYVTQALRASGATVEDQPYTVGSRTYRNVLARIGPETGERIVVGAHYDAAGEQPGADDNASGVAGLLELSRLIAAAPPPLRVELAAYTLEEPPNFAEDTMGSAVHAGFLAARNAKVRLMISVEMIGAFSDEPGSQSFPLFFGLFYPSTANFVAVVGKWGQGAAVDEVAASLRTASALPVETLSAPAFVTGIDFSDHRSFWEHGYSAVMITDTAFYRNPRYHTPEDRPETLDYARMAEVVKGLHCAVQTVARR
jgi:Zn-dependent M28 family amino/carboxypeptidase